MIFCDIKNYFLNVVLKFPQPLVIVTVGADHVPFSVWLLGPQRATWTVATGLGT